MIIVNSCKWTTSKMSHKVLRGWGANVHLPLMKYIVFKALVFRENTKVTLQPKRQVGPHQVLPDNVVVPTEAVRSRVLFDNTTVTVTTMECIIRPLSILEMWFVFWFFLIATIANVFMLYRPEITLACVPVVGRCMWREKQQWPTGPETRETRTPESQSWTWRGRRNTVSSSYHMQDASCQQTPCKSQQTCRHVLHRMSCVWPTSQSRCSRSELHSRNRGTENSGRRWGSGGQNCHTPPGSTHIIWLINY